MKAKSKNPCLKENCPIIIFGIHLLKILSKDWIELEKNEAELKQALQSIIKINMQARNDDLQK